jgi:nicotinate phosphoribosyltransferase
VTTDAYSDAYFVLAREVLSKDDRNPQVTMQVFQRKHSVLCGVKEALDYLGGWGLQIESLRDGDEIRPWETVMHIRGPYRRFAALETQYLGILARGTMVATNTRRIVEAARGKPVFFMGARHTHWKTQESDGYAAIVGGASFVGTDASGSAVGDRGMGTMPHSLIAAYGGGFGAACEALASHTDGPVTALVDFHNDSLADIAIAASVLGDRLAAVRLDTSGSLVDACLAPSDNEAVRGVNPLLVGLAREKLDALGRPDVKIVVSGGFDAEKVRWFEDDGAPVDVYGVGSSILVGSNDFTADIVEVDGRRVSKVGRSYAAVGAIQEEDKR